MAKIEVKHTLDYMGTSCVKLRKNRGQITLREAWETLTREEIYGPRLILMNISEELPADLYEEGDEWTLYTPDDFFPELSELKFNDGYEAAVKDYREAIENYKPN